MEIIKAKIPDVLILEPKVFGDDRGFCCEGFNEQAFIVRRIMCLMGRKIRHMLRLI